MKHMLSRKVTLSAITALSGISNFPVLASIVTLPYKKENHIKSKGKKHKQFHLWEQKMQRCRVIFECGFSRQNSIVELNCNLDWICNI